MKTINELFSKKVANLYDPVIRKDCRDCVLQPDLGNTNCIRCLCNSVYQNDGCDKIIITSGVIMELSDDCIPIINDMSRNFCGNSFGKGNKRCPECPLGHMLDDDLWSDFTEENINTIIERLKYTYIDCPDCEGCVSYAYSRFLTMRDEYRRLSQESMHLANRIVGV